MQKPKAVVFLLASAILAGNLLSASAAIGGEQPAIAESIAPAASAAPTRPSTKTWIRASARRADYLVFVKPHQGISGKFAGAEDVSLIGSQGTVISTDNHLPILHNGCVLVTCRRGSAVLTTRLTSVTVPAGMTALIDCIPATATVRVCAVSGDGKAITANSRKGRQFYSLKVGQDVTFNDRTRETVPGKFDAVNVDAEVASLLHNAGVNGTPLRMLGADGSEFRCAAADTIVLRSGQLFLQVPDKVIIQTPVCDAVGGKGAIMDVDADADYMRLKAFSGPGHALAVCGDRTIEVSPGQELLIAPHNIEDSDLNPPDGVGRRRNETVRVNENLKGATCDFSIMSFLSECPHVLAVKKALGADDKGMLDKILKTTAAVQTITQAKYGPYRSVSRVTKRRGSPGTPRQGGGSA